MVHLGLLLGLLPQLLLGATAELPRIHMNTAYAPPTGGKTLRVLAGDSLQKAFDAARPGDIIELEAGATFRGRYVLRPKAGTGWIYIRSSRHAELPAPGNRIAPADATLMAKLEGEGTGSGGRAIDIVAAAGGGASHIRFVGIEITTSHDTKVGTVTNLVTIGFRENGRRPTSVAEHPHHIVFDRVYLHGTPTGDIRNGICMDGEYIAVIDSHIEDIHSRSESHALYSYNGAGPHKIVNNFIAAAAVDILYGGWDPVIPNLVTGDVEIRGNLITKDLGWQGSEWMVKNLFELKNARRVLLDGNILEHSWAADQVGDAILIKSTNQGNTGRPGCDWCLSEDVTIRNNIVRHVAGGVRLSGRDSGAPYGGQTSRVLIHNNLFYDIDKAKWGGGRNETGRTLTITEDFVDVQFTHNTAIASPANEARDISMQSTLGPVGSGLVIQNNVITRTGEAVRGDGIAEGTATLEAYAPGYRFENNVIVGGLLSKSPYPANNFLLPEDLSLLQFVDLGAHDYRLRESSPYKSSATDGRDLGADIDAIETATTCSLRGQCDTTSGSAVERVHDLHQ